MSGSDNIPWSRSGRAEMVSSIASFWMAASLVTFSAPAEYEKICGRTLTTCRSTPAWSISEMR